jgi:alanine racemase
MYAMNLHRLTRPLRNKFDRHTPLITVSISKENLLHNLQVYKKKYPNLSFAPVLKSNAYGHGLVPIAQILDTEDIAFFMVDSYFEARTLRHSGIRSRILVMGYVDPEEIARNSLRTTDYTIVDREQLLELARIAQKPIRLQLKIDTGMHRQGILPEDIEMVLTAIQSNSNLKLVGVGSHFADADNPDSDENNIVQLARWKKALAQVEEAFPLPLFKHIAATKGVRFGSESGTNVARLGIGLYGFDTSIEGGKGLRPVLELRTRISSLREVPAGDFVGYNATHKAKTPIIVATIPLGYFEGIDRALSGRGSMKVRNVSCPIIGRVSMNMSSIDVTAVPAAKRGDVVVAISRDPSDSNSLEHIALLAGGAETLYTLLVHIPQHLKRVVE